MANSRKSRSMVARQSRSAMLSLASAVFGPPTTSSTFPPVNGALFLESPPPAACPPRQLPTLQTPRKLLANIGPQFSPETKVSSSAILVTVSFSLIRARESCSFLLLPAHRPIGPPPDTSFMSTTASSGRCLLTCAHFNGGVHPPSLSTRSRWNSKGPLNSPLPLTR